MLDLRLGTLKSIAARAKRNARALLSDRLAAAALAASLGLWTLWGPDWGHAAGAALPLLTGLMVVTWLVGHDWGAETVVHEDPA